LDDARLVAGGGDESVIDPQWSPGGVRPTTARLSHGLVEPVSRGRGALTSLEGAEIGFPRWIFAMRSYAFLGDGRIACVVTRDAGRNARVARSGARDVRNPRARVDRRTRRAHCALTEAASSSPPRSPDAAVPAHLVRRSQRTGSETLRDPLQLDVDLASISVACARDRVLRPATVRIPRIAFYYPPANAESEGPRDEWPPFAA